MKIAFDVDGIMTDLVEFQIKYGKKYFKNRNIEIDDTKLNFKEMFHCTEQEENDFWKKYIWRYCLKEKPRKGVKELIDKLKSEGNEIYIFTGRAHTTENGFVGQLFRSMIKYWFDKEKIQYDYMLFCKEEESPKKKSEWCERYKIDFMFEDQTKNINPISVITKVITLDEKHNKDCETENVIKLNDINNAYEQIKKHSICYIKKR